MTQVNDRHDLIKFTRIANAPILTADQHYDGFGKPDAAKMISDLDIWCSARVLVKRHGDDAPIEAAMRADAMLGAGDLDGYRTWKRILWAIAELQGDEPKAVALRGALHESRTFALPMA